MYKVARLALFVAMGVCSSASAFAATIAPCNASFTACSIVENTSLQLPFFAIAGDVIVRDPGTSVVSDVFRIFNNVLDTGGGTGLGNMVFLYSADDGALPNPATYSATPYSSRKRLLPTQPFLRTEPSIPSIPSPFPSPRPSF